jgi:hypothetical protein
VGGERTGAPGDRAELILVAAVSLAFALPLALSPYVPGGDAPWHAAVVAILATGDPDRFLGMFETQAGLGTYVAVYRLLALLARVVGAAAAVQILSVLVVIGFVWAARSLARSFGADGAVAILAAPAAYSTTLEFGFLVYLPSMPLTLWLWALIRTTMRHGATRRRVAAMAGAWIGICLCHAFAAAVAGLGAALLWLCEQSRERRGRAALIGVVMVTGALPAVFALAGVSIGTRQFPGLDRAPLWDRLMTQVFVPPLESIARAPSHVVGYVGDAWRVGLVAALLAVAIGWRIVSRSSVASSAEPETESSASRRAGVYLVALLAVLYLITPFTFEWPRNWYGAQPRIVPLLWVAALVALGPSCSRWGRGAALAVAAAALVCLTVQALLPHAAEARDLAAVIERSPSAPRTLGLIEQRPAVDRDPPDPFRNAVAWMMAERGGFASHLPMLQRSVVESRELIPVHLAEGAAPVPPAPPLGFARAFRWERHAAGWDQFLIRDLDPARPRDYFTGHAAEVETVVRAGRWRLVRRIDAIGR